MNISQLFEVNTVFQGNRIALALESDGCQFCNALDSLCLIVPYKESKIYY